MTVDADFGNVDLDEVSVLHLFRDILIHASGYVWFGVDLVV